MNHTKWTAVIVLVIAVLLLILFFSRQDTLDPEDIVEIDENGIVEQVEEKSNKPKTVDVQLRVFGQGYSPALVEVNRYDTVRFHIRSTDNRKHGFVIQLYDIEEVVNPGEETVVEFIAKSPGSFEYFSNIASVPNFDNIRGILKVNDIDLEGFEIPVE